MILLNPGCVIRDYCRMGQTNLCRTSQGVKSLSFPKGSSLYLARFSYQLINRVAPGTGVLSVIMLRITSFVVFLFLVISCLLCI